MQSRMVELWVGVFVAIGLAALAMLAFQVGNLSGTDIGDGYTVEARFDNIGGLSVKAPVTMAGVRIGRVSDIRVDKDQYMAVVKMEIGSRYDNLPTDTSASVLTSGLLGAQYVGLEPSGAMEFLEDGDEITLTQSALVLEHLIGQFIFSQGEGGGGGTQ